MQDIEYKKDLIQGLTGKSDDYTKLSSIVGKEELIEFLLNNQHNETIYTPQEDLSNVKNKKFRANLHIHTTNSDGLMTVERLLNLGAQYGDAIAQKSSNNKFYLAITDHNTTAGTIEALKIVTKNPEKYKNLKIILGVEASAMFTSQSIGKTNEVHLLSYCLNPFEDRISLINQKRLRIFQYNIKNALNNANIRYIDTISKYGIEFNFEDMSKIRPSIKTCASNVRYSMKDYLQFKILYTELVSSNTELLNYLTSNGVAINNLDFSIPKSMITESKYTPYWKNYEETLYQYLKREVLKENKYANIDEYNNLYGIKTTNLIDVLHSMESGTLDPNSNMYIKEPSPLSFDEVIDSFKQSKTSISGIAHGALYEQNNPKQNLFLQDLYKSFKEKMGTSEVIGEMFYPYKENINRNLAKGLIQLYKYIPTGGQDSHKNNFFSPQTSFSQECISDLIKTSDKISLYINNKSNER